MATNNSSTYKILIDQSNNIERFVMEIRQLQYIINNCHFMLNSLHKNPELQEVHAQETLPLIHDYNKLVVELKDILEDHFEWEHENNKPRNFTYWRLYYELEKEDLYY